MNNAPFCADFFQGLSGFCSIKNIRPKLTDLDFFIGTIPLCQFIIVRNSGKSTFGFAFGSFHNNEISLHLTKLFFCHAIAKSVKLLNQSNVAALLASIVSGSIRPFKNEGQQRNHQNDGTAKKRQVPVLDQLVQSVNFGEISHNSTTTEQVQKSCPFIKVNKVPLPLTAIAAGDTHFKEEFSATIFQSSGSIGGVGFFNEIVVELMLGSFLAIWSAKSTDSRRGTSFWLSFAGCHDNLSFLSSDIELSPVPYVFAGGDVRVWWSPTTSATFPITEFGDAVTERISSSERVWSDSCVQEENRRGVDMGQPSNNLTSVTSRLSRVSQTCETSLKLVGRVSLPKARPALLLNEAVYV